MKFDNNSIAILGVVGVAAGAITAAVIVHETEIATGLVALGSTAIGGVIGYLAKSQVPEKEQNVNNMADAIANALENGNDIYIDEVTLEEPKNEDKEDDQ